MNTKYYTINIANDSFDIVVRFHGDVLSPHRSAESHPVSQFYIIESINSDSAICYPYERMSDGATDEEIRSEIDAIHSLIYDHFDNRCVGQPNGYLVDKVDLIDDYHFFVHHYLDV